MSIAATSNYVKDGSHKYREPLRYIRRAFVLKTPTNDNYANAGSSSKDKVTSSAATARHL